MPSPVIFLLGPTASGKTALACTLQDRFAVELLSVDSALVYRGMNIGTAKPDAATLARHPHHLIDLIDPDQTYSAADFRRDALVAIEGCHARGKVPLIVGGTMMYVKALTGGLSALPPANPAIRAVFEAKAAERGWPALHLDLLEVDPATAARLSPNDSQRISRALEVHALTGVPLSALQMRAGDAANASGTFAYPMHIIALMPSDRAVLHARIASRFDDMLSGGLVDELAALQTRHTLTPELPSMRCVGYRQAWQFLAGEIDRKALRETGVAATRQLAKRQMTWLRSMPEATVLDCLSPALADDAASLVEGTLSRRDT